MLRIFSAVSSTGFSTKTEIWCLHASLMIGSWVKVGVLTTIPFTGFSVSAFASDSANVLNGWHFGREADAENLCQIYHEPNQNLLQTCHRVLQHSQFWNRRCQRARTSGWHGSEQLECCPFAHHQRPPHEPLMKTFPKRKVGGKAGAA